MVFVKGRGRGRDECTVYLNNVQVSKEYQLFKVREESFVQDWDIIMVMEEIKVKRSMFHVYLNTRGYFELLLEIMVK